MSRQRSMRAFVTVAILATVLMIFAPLAGLMSTTGSTGATQLSAATDCAMCPDAGMVMANCAQGLCGLPAMETASLAAVAIAPMRHALVRVAIPLGRHTVPPVSPG